MAIKTGLTPTAPATIATVAITTVSATRAPVTRAPVVMGATPHPDTRRPDIGRAGRYRNGLITHRRGRAIGGVGVAWFHWRHHAAAEQRRSAKRCDAAPTAHGCFLRGCHGVTPLTVSRYLRNHRRKKSFNPGLLDRAARGAHPVAGDQGAHPEDLPAGVADPFVAAARAACLGVVAGVAA